MFTIVGAGSIGLSVGGRLARAGADVAFLTRRPEAAQSLEARGVTVTDPASGSSFTARVRAFHRVEAIPGSHRHGIILLCVRATDTDAVAPWLSAALPTALFVCAQNDIDNEQRVGQHAARVSGLVHRQTCTRQDDATVFALGPGRIVVGDHPSGHGPDLERLALAAEAAGFDVGRSPEIARDKWLKLCVNLMSTPNALVRRSDHETVSFVEVKARLLEEARDVLTRAGIVATSCDGRDRSLEAEIAHQRASLTGGTSARRLPIYNAVWTALKHPGIGLEADRFHERIISMGLEHGVDTPVNRRVLATLQRAVRETRGPESVSAAELRP